MNIRDLRLTARMTQQELADRLDVHQSAVSLWESGFSKPCKKYRKKLCDIFECTEEELLGGDS